MKTEFEIQIELQKVRVLLQKAQANENLDTDMLYGAQQALGWVLMQLRAPSDLERVIKDISSSSSETQRR